MLADRETPGWGCLTTILNICYNLRDPEETREYHDECVTKYYPLEVYHGYERADV